jgi:O-acetyl-ADP-ribose deacetylase (regulator of RNase III)
MIELRDYAEHIALEVPWSRPEVFASVDEYRHSLSSLIEVFDREEGPLPTPYGNRFDTLRALLNVRPPKAIPDEVSRTLDRLLWTRMLWEVGTQDGDAGPTVRDGFDYSERHGERISLWRGDITCLEVDANVNAANAPMLGCFQPLHGCIDNAIHSAAGPRLREDCAKIMAIQGHPEPTGVAKITRGYNMAARFVIHTVGPIARGQVTESNARELVACYRSVLDLAAMVGGIETVALCGISTGVYGFPPDPAATIAIQTVTDWLDAHPDRFRRVVFNVFTEDEYERYAKHFSR